MLALGAIALIAPACSCTRRPYHKGTKMRAGALTAAVEESKRLRLRLASEGTRGVASYDRVSRVDEQEQMVPSRSACAMTGSGARAEVQSEVVDL